MSLSMVKETHEEPEERPHATTGPREAPDSGDGGEAGRAGEKSRFSLLHHQGQYNVLTLRP